MPDCAVEDCGCCADFRIHDQVGGFSVSATMRYCPMHAAAERMMTMLEVFARIVADAPDGPIKTWAEPLEKLLKEAGNA